MSLKMNQNLDALTDMLSTPDKKINESKNFLTYAARKIMLDYGLTIREYMSRTNMWLIRLYGKSKEANVQIPTTRNNFTKEVLQEEMTANVFQKFTDMMGASKVHMTIRMEFADGRADHVSQIVFSNRIDEKENDKDQE